MDDKEWPRRTTLYPILVIIAISFAVYFNALFNGFVYDDGIQVAANFWIRDASYIPDIFSKGVWSFWGETTSANYYRPLMHLIYMLAYHVFGLAPWGFHLMNVLFHAGAASLVFLLSRKLLDERGPSSAHSYLFPSFAAGVLFSVHPVHTEAVTWIAGVTEVSCAFFFLLSFYLYLRSTADTVFSPGTYILSVASFSLSVLCKETALTLPVVFVVYECVLRKEKTNLSFHAKRFIPFLVIIGTYIAVRVHALSGIVPQNQHAQLDTYRLLINVFPLFAAYLGKLLLPVRLNAFYVFHPVSSFWESRELLSLGATGLFAFSAFIAWRKSRPVLFGLLFVAVTLLPAFYIPGLGENVFAERYLYLPSAGFALLLALLVDRLRASFPRGATALNVVLAAVVVVFALGTVSRNSVWKDNYTLFRDTVEKSPDSATAHINLGVALVEKGRLDEAIREYQGALSLDPYYAKAYSNRGIAFAKLGRVDEAITDYRVALTLNPNSAEVHNYMGIAMIEKGFTDRGIEEYRIALALNPFYADAHNNLGVAYWKKKGWMDPAIRELQEAIRLNPDEQIYRANLSNALGAKIWLEKALQQMRRSGERAEP